MQERTPLGIVIVIGSVSAAWAAPPDPKIVEAINQIKPADYPSANTVSLLARQDVVYQKDGTYENTIHQIDLVLTADGRERTASHSLYYRKDAEAYDIKTVRVIKKDGTTRHRAER